MDSIKINNFNYAGGPLALGLIGGVSVVAIWAIESGLGNPGGRSIFYLVILGIWTLVIIYALVRLCTNSVFWIEIGDHLVFRDLFRVHTITWQELKTVYFDEEQSRMSTKIPGVSIPLGTHCILVIILRQGRELRIKVSSEQASVLRKIVGTNMPELKNRPFSQFR